MLTLLELALVIALPVLLVLAVMQQRRASAPGRPLIVYGRRGLGGRGHALVHGSTLLVPWLEAAETFSLEPIGLRSRRLFRARTGGELELELTATIRHPEHEERLLDLLQLLDGKSPEAIRELAEDALLGAASHVVADTEPSDCAADPEALARAIAAQAEMFLSELGLELETCSVIPGRGAQLPA